MFGLRSRPARALVTGRPWRWPDLDRFCDRVRDLPPGEAAGAVLDVAAAQRGVPEAHALLIAQAGRLLGDRVRDLQPYLAPIAARPGDPWTTADTLALEAHLLITEAWRVRGTAPAASVPADAWRPFHAMLDEADAAAHRANRAVPGHPAAGTALLTAALGLGVPEDDWWYRFEQARLLVPTHFGAHHAMTDALTDKWYGSDERSLDFARSVARSAPPEDPVGTVLVRAHVEALLRTGARQRPAAARREEDADLVRHLSQAFLASPGRGFGHPRAVEAHQLYGWWFATVARDRSRAAAHLALVADRVASYPWELTGDPAGEYARCLDDVRVPAG